MKQAITRAESALLKFSKVFLWVGVSGFLAAAIAFVSHYQVDAANLYQVGVIAILNASLASAMDFVKSRKPKELVETVVEV